MRLFTLPQRLGLARALNSGNALTAHRVELGVNGIPESQVSRSLPVEPMRDELRDRRNAIVLKFFFKCFGKGLIYE